MPRRNSKRLTPVSKKTYESYKKNGLSLLDDENLDGDLKSLRIGEVSTTLQLSKNEVAVRGDFLLDGKLVNPTLETDNDYLEFKPKIYTRFTSSDYSGSLDIYVAGGDAYFAPSGNDIYFLMPTGGNFIRFGTLGGILSQVKFDLFNGDYSFTSAANENEFFKIDIDANGVTALSTADSGGTAGHLTIAPDGDLVLDPVSQKTIINATDGLYFDGGTHTYIAESSSDILSFVVGGVTMLELNESVTDAVNVNNSDLTIDATKKLFFDGSVVGNTHMTESSADVLDITVGGDIIFQITESGADGNTIDIDNACIGFTQLEPTYNAVATNVDFRHSNKQHLTFGSGNIAHLVLYFPLVSGNFQLLIKQDGTGSRTITGSYKVYEFDESVADGSSTVKFAGGSNPTLTTDANHVDILSFYWDADNEIAYGVATLDFQF